VGRGGWGKTYAVEGVKEDLGRALLVEERLDGLKVKDLLEERDVVGCGVDDLDRERADRRLADRLEVDLGQVRHRLVLGQRLCELVDLLGHILGRRTAVGAVVLDAKVVLGPARVVRGRQEDAALDALVLADDVRDGRGRQDRVVADDELGDAVAGREPGDRLDRLARKEAAVTADDERLAGRARRDRRQGCLDEVLGVVLLV